MTCIECEKLAAENARLRRQRNLWQARALAMFWKLPPEMTVKELQDDARRAGQFFGFEPEPESQ